MDNIITIDKISKKYTQWQRTGKVKDIVKNLFNPEKKEVNALDNLSFNVKKGDFLAYAGANGAGKSTTIKILSGILQPSSGEIKVLGMNPAKDRVKLMNKVGVLFGQRTELWWDQPIISSFEWKKDVWNIPSKIYDENLKLVTELLDLSDIIKTFARDLSLGQRMRADLAMMLLHSPEVIFLDEPTLGLDVLAKRQMIGFLKNLNRENGTTIVVTSHDMDDLEEMAQRIILLSGGKLIFDGDFDQLRKVRDDSFHINLTFNGIAPVLSSMTYAGSHDNIHEYIVKNGNKDLRHVFAELSRLDGIQDVEIQKAPIEQVIANLYIELKENGRVMN